MIEYPNVHGGDQWGKCRFEFPNGLEQSLRLGLRDEDITPSQINGQIHCGGETKYVEKRQRAQHDFVAVERGEPCADLLNLFAQVAVGEHNTFGNTGGPPGVLIHGNIIKR